MHLAHVVQPLTMCGSGPTGRGAGLFLLCNTPWTFLVLQAYVCSTGSGASCASCKSPSCRRRLYILLLLLPHIVHYRTGINSRMVSCFAFFFQQHWYKEASDHIHTHRHCHHHSGSQVDTIRDTLGIVGAVFDTLPKLDTGRSDLELIDDHNLVAS